MKALEMLKTEKSITEVAENYVASIKRELQREVIDALQKKKEAFDDEKFKLQNFSLQTNLNAGTTIMSREECQARFKRLIEVDFEIEMLELEIESKKKAFETYFG